MLSHIDLFSGIGGFSISAEWAGFTTVLFVEKDDYCQKVLRKHWPNVPIIGDIREFTEWDGGAVDLVTGGFPCQDLSTAGRKAGIYAPRSGLWQEAIRVINEMRPRWVVIENVYHSWRRWVPVVRRELWGIGYASVPFRVSASEVGACHRRARGFVVANTDSAQLRLLSGWRTRARGQEAIQPTAAWDWTPRGLGTNDGVPHRVDRCRCLGNAIVPAVAFEILRSIMEIEA